MRVAAPGPSAAQGRSCIMEPDNSLAVRDVRSVIHPFTDLAHHVEEGPMVLTRGEGVYVLDERGHRYLEGMAGLWCANLGFSEERLVDAAREQMSRLPTYHLFGGKSHGPAIALAERLLAMAPAPMSKVLFTSSGSEANDTAIKLVRFTVRRVPAGFKTCRAAADFPCLASGLV